MVEELWEQLGCAAEYGKMAMQMPWPEYDESKTVAAHTEMAVQVNGKLKGTVTVRDGQRAGYRRRGRHVRSRRSPRRSTACRSSRPFSSRTSSST